MNATEISSSRRKAALYLGMSLAFVAIAVLALQHPDRDDAGKFQAVLVFFLLCAVVFVWLLIRPQRLLLDNEGFTLAGGLVFSPKKVCWRDIDAFFVYRLPRGGKMISFNYKPGAREASPMTKLSRRLGADGALPKGWVESPETMVDKLNGYRLQADTNMATGRSA